MEKWCTTLSSRRSCSNFVGILLFVALVVAPSLSFSIQPERTSLTAVKKNQKSLSDIDRRRLLQIVLFTPASALSTNAAIPIQPASAGFLPETAKATTTFAKDKFGSELIAKHHLASKQARDRSLVLGIKDEPTYLIVNDDKTQLESYALNGECSHLGCIVPWNAFENKFVCPCHGSQYDALGNVLRGPAPYGLALAHVSIDEGSGKIMMTPWTETDFRTNQPPWWK